MFMSPAATPPEGSRALPRSGAAELARVQRERIMDAMAATVAEVGYLETTMRTVVSRARVSATTYYDLFEDKEDCFLATVDERIERTIAAITAACAAAPEPERRFQCGLEAFLELCAREPDTAHLCVVELAAAGPAARARRAEMMKRLFDLAEPALAEIRPQTADARMPRLTATIVVGGIHHLVQDRIARDDAERLPELAPEILRLVLPALGGREAP
jgi:AcrR family transcriptional regulator